MKKTTYICDVCNEQFNYIVNQSVKIHLGDLIIKDIGDICDNCLGHLRVDITNAVDSCMRSMKKNYQEL